MSKEANIKNQNKLKVYSDKTKRMTLNQIVKQITEYGNNHEQIKFVYFGCLGKIK